MGRANSALPTTRARSIPNRLSQRGASHGGTRSSAQGDRPDPSFHLGRRRQDLGLELAIPHSQTLRNGSPSPTLAFHQRYRFMDGGGLRILLRESCDTFLIEALRGQTSEHEPPIGPLHNEPPIHYLVEPSHPREYCLYRSPILGMQVCEAQHRVQTLVSPTTVKFHSQQHT